MIVTQDLCEVCAVSLDDVRSAVARLAHREQIAIVSTSPTRLAHVLDDLVRIGRALGRDGESIRTALQVRIDAIAARARPSNTRVVTLEWIEPLMIGGTWMPELVELAGGIPVGAIAGGPAPTISPAELRTLDPEVVIIKACGFTVERTLAERATIERDVIAHTNARVYVTDGNAYFNRPGPRLVESLEITAACIDPESFGDFATKHAGAIVRL